MGDTLTPAMFHILVALTDEDRHGYSIMKEVGERTAGAVKLGPATLYGTLQRLLALGLVVERPLAAGDDPRRRLYRLSARGQKAALAEADEQSALLRTARRRLAARRA